jgi:hypothetical protein
MAKARGRPFSPGNAAGSGRPTGSRNKATQAAQGLFAEYAEPVTKKCVALAMQGDSTGMRLAMERILPARRSAPLQFKLPKMKSLSDIPKGAHAILTAVAEGQLTPDDGDRVMALLERYGRILETTGILPRLEVLESLERQRQQLNGKR